MWQDHCRASLLRPSTCVFEGLFFASVVIFGMASRRPVVKPGQFSELQDSDSLLIKTLTSPSGASIDVDSLASEQVSIAAFGAVPNSSGAAAANTTAIQNAINAAVASPRRRLFIPAGTWYCNALTLSGSIIITGTGHGTSILKFAPTSGYLFSYVLNSAPMRGSLLQDLQLQGAGRTAGTHVGFFGRHLQDPPENSTSNRGIVFSRVRVSEFFRGVVLHDSYGCLFDSCEIVGNGNVGALTGGGIHFDRVNFGDVSSTGSLITNCLIESNGRGVFSDDDVNDQVLGCKMEKCIFEGNGYGIWFKRSSYLTLDGCYFEANTTKAVHSSQLMAFECSKHPATELTTDAFEITGQLNEFHRRYIELSYGGTSVFKAELNDTDQGVTALIADSGAIQIGTTGGVKLYKGEGSPESVVTASSGSLYFNSAATNRKRIVYVKTTDGANTGWAELPGEPIAVAADLASLPSPSVDGEIIYATDVNVLLINDAGTWRTIHNLTSFQSLTNGGTYAFGGRGGLVFNRTTGTIAAHTFTLPDTTYAKGGDVAVVETRGAITSAGFSSAVAINGAPSTIPANSTVRFRYDANIPAWVRVDSASATIPRALHVARRASGSTNITTRTTIAYDASDKAVNSSYLSYASGVWTAAAACSVLVTAEFSFKANSGAVNPIAILAVYRGSGGTQNTLVQEMSTQVYSTTNINDQLVVTAWMTLAVNDQFRVTIESDSGIDTIANRSTCRVVLDL